MRAHDHRPSDNEQAVRARTAAPEPAPEQAQIMRMQQGAGNQAVTAMLARKTVEEDVHKLDNGGKDDANRNAGTENPPSQDTENASTSNPATAAGDTGAAAPSNEMPAPDTQDVKPGETQNTAPDEPAAAEELDPQN